MVEMHDHNGSEGSGTIDNYMMRNAVEMQEDDNGGDEDAG